MRSYVFSGSVHYAALAPNIGASIHYIHIFYTYCVCVYTVHVCARARARLFSLYSLAAVILVFAAREGAVKGVFFH